MTLYGDRLSTTKKHTFKVIEPTSKLSVDWGYDDFLSGAPQSFELTTLGFPISTVRLLKQALHVSLILFLLSFHLFLPRLESSIDIG